jgi:hypothetical protein
MQARCDEGGLDATRLAVAMSDLFGEVKHVPMEFFCVVCKKPACFGFGVRLLKGRKGVWYCSKHRPNVPPPSDETTGRTKRPD